MTLPHLQRDATVEAAVPAANSHATRVPLQLRAINHNDFALIWPVLRAFHKTGSHRILTNIIPFFGVTFVAAQNVIKKSSLPKLALTLQRQRLRALAHQSSRRAGSL